MTIWFEPVTVQTRQGREDIRTPADAIELLVRLDWRDREMSLSEQDLFVRCIDICLADLEHGMRSAECRDAVVEMLGVAGLRVA